MTIERVILALMESSIGKFWGLGRAFINMMVFINPDLALYYIILYYIILYYIILYYIILYYIILY